MVKSRTRANSSLGGGRQFAATRWSVVLVAGRRSSPDSRRSPRVVVRSLLVSAVRVRSSAGGGHQRSTRLDAGFLRRTSGEELCRLGNSRARPLPRLSADRVKAISYPRNGRKPRPRSGAAGKTRIPLDFESARFAISSRAGVSGLTAEQIYDREWAVALLGRTLQAARGRSRLTPARRDNSMN